MDKVPMMPDPDLRVSVDEVLARASGAPVRVTANMHRALGLLHTALVEAARQQKTVTYEQASAATDSAYLPQGMGPLLDVLHESCLRRGEPSLSALVVRKGRHPGSEDRTSNTAAQQQACFDHWTTREPRPLEHLGTSRLLADYAGILAELRTRGVVRTGNAPAGDYGEWLVAQAFGVGLEANSQKSYDLVLPDGRRVQVKTRLVCDPPRSGQQQTSPFRSWDFDLAALVLLDDSTYRVRRAVLLPIAATQAASRRSEHVNGAFLQMTPQVLDGPDAEDATQRLRAVQRASDQQDPLESTR